MRDAAVRVRHDDDPVVGVVARLALVVKAPPPADELDRSDRFLPTERNELSRVEDLHADEGLQRDHDWVGGELFEEVLDDKVVLQLRRGEVSECMC